MKTQTVRDFLLEKRLQQKTLYESSAVSYARWLGHYGSKWPNQSDDTAPDGFPYSMGPKVPKKIQPTITLAQITEAYEKDLKEIA